MKSHSYSLLGLLAILFIVAVKSATTNTSDFTLARESAVKNLAIDNFDDFINSHAMVMVEFYAPWCAVCQELEPIYEQTALLVDITRDIKFARVDCVTYGTLCDKYRTPIYPTLRLFQGTEQQEIYNGRRVPSDMISYAERRYRPVITVLTKEDIEDFKNTEEVVVIGYWESDDKVSNNTFTRVAQSHLDYYTFGATNDPDAALADGVSQPSLILYKPYDNRKVLYEGTFQEDAINDFVVLESIPLVGEYNHKWAWRYFGEGTIPFAGVFANTVSERETLMDMVRPVAQEYQGIIRFAAVDPDESNILKTKFDLQETQLPVFAIKDLHGQIFPISPETELTEQVIRQWVRDFNNGNLLPYIKPKPTLEASEVSEDHITLVTDDNFDEIVLGSDHDVLVEFYAPWCGHCQRLVPVYAQLATLYANHDQTVRVAKVDAAANKIPGQEVASFPTIKLFSAGAKDTPILYTGNRTLEDLVKFVQQNSRDKVDVIKAIRDGNGALDNPNWSELTKGIKFETVNDRQTGQLSSDEL